MKKKFQKKEKASKKWFSAWKWQKGRYTRYRGSIFKAVNHRQRPCECGQGCGCREENMRGWACIRASWSASDPGNRAYFEGECRLRKRTWRKAGEIGLYNMDWAVDDENRHFQKGVHFHDVKMAIFKAFWTDLSTLFLHTSEKIRGQSVGKMRIFRVF